MAPVALVFVAAYGVLMFVSSPRLRAASSAVFDARSMAQSHFIESITGIQTIKSLATEAHTYRTAFGLIDQLKTREFAAANLAFHVGQIGSLLNQLSIVVVLGWGASLALEGRDHDRRAGGVQRAARGDAGAADRADQRLGRFEGDAYQLRAHGRRAAARTRARGRGTRAASSSAATSRSST